MKKNTPLVVFTGLAVVAAGTLGAVLTGNYPGADAPQPVAEAPATPSTDPAAPAQQTAEVPAAASAPAAEPPPQPAATAETAVTAPAAQAETQVASAPAQAMPQEQPAAAPAAGTAAAVADPNVPAFDTVNVMPTGETVVAGHGKPGSEVVLKFAGVEVSRATAGADGSFAMVPDKPLPVGAGELTLEANVDGKVLASVDQIAVVVNRDQKPALVAKVEPEAPTQIVQAPAAVAGEVPKDVQLSAVDYDSEGNIVFQGRVTPSGTVRFYVDNQLAGDATADAAGNWLFKGTAPIAPGTHTLRADEIDAAGKVISRAELPFLREEAEEVIAAAGQAGVQDSAAAAGEQTAAEPDQIQAKSEEPAQQVAAATPPAQGTAETQPVAAAAPSLPSRVVIQPGNNLWRISREVYGKGRLFTVIWEANRDQIKNPNRIYPGQILTAPKS